MQDFLYDLCVDKNLVSLGRCDVNGTEIDGITNAGIGTGNNTGLHDAVGNGEFPKAVQADSGSVIHITTSLFILTF